MTRRADRPPLGTPEERRLRDLLATVKARLRRMQADPLYSPQARAEAGRLADLIAARVDGKGEE